MTKEVIAAVIAMTAALVSGSPNAHAQSLEKSFAEMCDTPAKKQTEACQVMAQALVAKLQGDGVERRLSDSELRTRWGALLDVLDMPMFAINCDTGSFDLSQRVTFSWKVADQVMTRTTSKPDGTIEKVLTYRWDDARGQVVLPLEGAGDMQLGTKPNGDVVGLFRSGPSTLRTVLSKAGTGLSTMTDINHGQGWVLKAYAVYLEATAVNLANAQQTAESLKKSYQLRKSIAEDMAKMQGGRSDAEFERYLADLEQRNKARAEERRQRERESGERFNQFMGAVHSGLVVANGVASSNEAQSRAAVDRPLAQTNAAGRNHAQPAPTAARGGAGADAVERSGAPLRFVLGIGMEPRKGDAVNPTCYSNVIVRPGPPGWGQGGSLPPGSAARARATVQEFKSSFIAACRAASGREITSEGNFHWTWNEMRDGDQQVGNARARYREDVTVNVN